MTMILGQNQSTMTYLDPHLNPYTSVEREERPLDEHLFSSEIREVIIAVFGEESVLVDIAKCESGFRQFNSDKEVLKGEKNNDDIGLYQINKLYHLEKSIELGFDINTIKGNISYAKYLYDRQGTKPWNWSKKCWSK